MRLITLVLVCLLLLIQYPLWLGKGGWLRAWDLEAQLKSAQAHNESLRERNAMLASEVDDLRDGTGAIEERARFELGMIRDGEVFVQILGEHERLPPPPPPAPDLVPVTTLRR